MGEIGKRTEIDRDGRERSGNMFIDLKRHFIKLYVMDISTIVYYYIS